MVLYSLLYNYTMAPWFVNTEGHSALAKYESLYKVSLNKISLKFL